MKLGVPAEQNVPDFAPVRTTRYRVVQCATHRTLLGVKTPSSREQLEQLYCRVMLPSYSAIKIHIITHYTLQQ